MTRILPQRITDEHIIGNIDYMRHSGAHIVYRGAEYWIDWAYDPDVIWWISEDRRASGSINGREYARIVNGTPYRIAN
jgi:hypothetical protein